MAPVLPSGLVDGVEWLLRTAGPRLPVLGGMVAGNMRAAGVYSDAAFRAYFEQVALHLCNAARIFRLRRCPGAVARLAGGQIDLDPSIDHLRGACAGGRGVVLAPAHTTNYVLTLARLNQAVPLCIFLRWSSDTRRQAMKRDWCEACGIEVVMEPASEANPTARAAACVEILRSGRVLAITPDIAQKEADGVAVDVLGRRAHLPSGMAAIALLAEAPIVPLFGRLDGKRQALYCCPPLRAEMLPRAEGGRRAAIQRATQAWAVHFEDFLRAAPAAWFLWGDSRWTKVFRLDPRYARPHDEAPRPGLAASVPA
jgi:predicted LPLAT superfamily acyltransferase